MLCALLALALLFNPADIEDDERRAAAFERKMRKAAAEEASAARLALLEISAEEDNGILNLVPRFLDLRDADGKRVTPSQVRIFGFVERAPAMEKRLFLSGGHKALLALPEGRYTVAVRTPVRHQHGCAPDEGRPWLSPKLTLHLRPDYRTEVEITGKEGGRWLVHLGRLPPRTPR